MSASSENSRRYSAVSAGIVWNALLMQLVLTIEASMDNGKTLSYALLLYSGYFTILTNLLAALVLTAALLPPSDNRFWRTLRRPWLRTAVTAAILVVGLVYFLILRHAWQPQGLQWFTDALLHYLNPLLMLAFWIRVSRRGDLAWRELPCCLIYPLAYLLYVFARGALTGMYPYPFIDVPAIGHAQAFCNALAILAGFGSLCGVLFWLNRTAGRPAD